MQCRSKAVCCLRFMVLGPEWTEYRPESACGMLRHQFVICSPHGLRCEELAVIPRFWDSGHVRYVLGYRFNV